MSRAATITWSSPANIAGDSDVSTAGTLFQAANVVHVSGVTTTINGVNFARFEVQGGPTHSLGNFTLNSIGGIQGYPSYGSGSVPFSNLSSSYRALLEQGGFGPNTITLDITGLTVGNMYQIQFWANDSQNTSGSLQTLTAGNAVVLDPNTSNVSGGTGQFAIGLFTANASTQQISLSSGGTVHTNGFQLRTIPEPSTFILLGVAGSAFLLLRRRLPNKV